MTQCRYSSGINVRSHSISWYLWWHNFLQIISKLKNHVFKWPAQSLRKLLGLHSKQRIRLPQHHQSVSSKPRTRFVRPQLCDSAWDAISVPDAAWVVHPIRPVICELGILSRSQNSHQMSILFEIFIATPTFLFCSVPTRNMGQPEPDAVLVHRTSMQWSTIHSSSHTQSSCNRSCGTRYFSKLTI